MVDEPPDPVVPPMLTVSEPPPVPVVPLMETVSDPPPDPVVPLLVPPPLRGSFEPRPKGLGRVIGSALSFWTVG